MAFLLTKEPERIKVIARCDDALWIEDKDDFDEIYVEYLRTLDESLLTFAPEKSPTRFVLKKNLNLSESIRIKNEQVRVNQKGDFSFQMGFTIEEVRISLVDIENPPNVLNCLAYKADGSGGASKDLMDKLLAVGIVDDLYSALLNSRKGKDINKKN